MTDTVLVFPAGLPDALKYRDEAAARGSRVVGASSLGFDPVSQTYDAWEYLPYVHEDGFADALGEVIRRQDVGSIYAPHEVVSGVISRLAQQHFPQVRVLGVSPMLAKEREYRTLHGRAEALSRTPDWLTMDGVSRPRLSGPRLSGLLRTVDHIAGMTDNDKIAAVVEIFRYLPQGDIVEIGSWWGRSAALMVLLSHHYDIGNLLCVDPWQSENLAQGVAVLDQASAAMDTDEAFRIFQTNLAPLANGRLNAFRGESVVGAAAYRPGLRLENDAFGETEYIGRIALLHIDGNHSFENADADARAWTPHVVPGGVIIFDDYVWAFGDGPKRVGDAFLTANASRIAQSFVTGTALFVQLKAGA
jgi:hypothetical protein